MAATNRALVTKNKAAMTTWAVPIKISGLGVMFFSPSFHVRYRGLNGVNIIYSLLLWFSFFHLIGMSVCGVQCSHLTFKYSELCMKNNSRSLGVALDQNGWGFSGTLVLRTFSVSVEVKNLLRQLLTRRVGPRTL